MLSPHPLAELFPLMDDETFKGLVASIRANGLLEPITLHEGMILDGRNRYRACIEIGVEPIMRQWDGSRGTPLDFVISKNLHRRHLDESQRAMVAERVANMREGRPAKTRPIGLVSETEPEQPTISQTQAAKMLNVSQRSVKRARVVRTSGVDKLQKAVETGAAAVATAAELAAKPQEEQKQIIALIEGAHSKINSASVWKASAINQKAVPELKQAVESGEVSLNAAEYVSRQPHEEQRKLMAQGAKAIAQAAWETNKTKRSLSQRSPSSGNSKRSETQKLKAEVWRQLRDAMELLCGLPDPAEVAEIAASFSGARPVVDVRLPQALTWLEGFNNEWCNRNRGQDSSAA